ncbi:UNVERIFIED_ORG: hypothetical protein M2438_002564 [Methylobacterium sp. SuP10 SLI 274]|uniref:hypothetical protein n=1 Tax=Methylorubrum extorquens TaxID=408 RepID=UPI0020A0A1D2|nr:hypothetical protein [Methylorubrum extorquens]MDF9863790.1 hypothetical protein [Methylorubrum pseudosasae]MDH6637389.1 hypothetical protein [Methylobacterium sp. SuP10 SLI 274]MDH6666569.1 hypothetical protein [Methylorubrum zatmanii]MCP1558479.1 hypothetical protein [Methylorubrum extorquens]MDF9792105.1 hypothetical protein [Methylorubrum extorquens]
MPTEPGSSRLPEPIDAFMRVAPIELQRAPIIALHTGPCQADILRLPWSAYDGSAITLRQGKSARGGRLAPMVTIPARERSGACWMVWSAGRC